MALLGELFGGGNQQSGGGMGAMQMALLGVLAYRTVKGKGRLADMLGMGSGAQSPQGQAVQSDSSGMLSGLTGMLGGGLGGLGGMLSGVTGGNPGAAVSDGLAVCTATDGKVRAFKVTDGERAWLYDAKMPLFAPPAVAGGVVYAADLSGTVHAIDLKTGLAKWTFPLWMYVSVTGVIVYFFLYHWFPS